MPKIILYTPGSDTVYGPLVIADGQLMETALISYPLSTQAVHIDYLIERAGEAQTGQIMIAHDGTEVTLTDNNTDTAAELGIIFSGSISGGQMHVQYISTGTGFAATIRYYEKKW